MDDNVGLASLRLGDLPDPHRRLRPRPTDMGDNVGLAMLRLRILPNHEVTASYRLTANLWEITLD